MGREVEYTHAPSGLIYAKDGFMDIHKTKVERHRFHLQACGYVDGFNEDTGRDDGGHTTVNTWTCLVG